MLGFMCVAIVIGCVVVLADVAVDNYRMRKLAEAYQQSRPAMTILSPAESFEVRRKHLQLVQQGLIDAMNKSQSNQEGNK